MPPAVTVNTPELWLIPEIVAGLVPTHGVQLLISVGGVMVRSARLALFAAENDVVEIRSADLLTGEEGHIQLLIDGYQAAWNPGSDASAVAL